jgi:hypothetical protein
VTSTGQYALTISDGCEPSFVFYEVDIAPEMRLALAAQAEIHLGEELTLEPLILNNSDSLAIEWFDPLGNSLSCLDCPEPVAIPLQDVQYILRVNNEVCRDTAVIDVLVDKTRRIYIPNVFSPNGDGVNDYFYVQSPDPGRIRSFTVYDRWGSVLTDIDDSVLNDLLSGWDGRSKGELLNSGVYLYFMQIEFLDGEVEEFVGTVTILR